MNDRERATKYFNENIAPQYTQAGVLAEHIAAQRTKYIADALANPTAVKELREMYP